MNKKTKRIRRFRSILLYGLLTLYLAGVVFFFFTILPADRRAAIMLALFFILIAVPIVLLSNRSARKVRQEYNKQLYQDGLTLLPNRTRLLSDIRGTKIPVLLLVNIDSFKEINDFYGNQTGDYILVLMANRLRLLMVQFAEKHLSSLKDPYRLYKMTADEYAILLDGVFAEETTQVLIRHLWKGVSEKPFLYGGNPIHIHVAIGVSCAKEECAPETNIVRKWEIIPNQADMALKQAKKHNQRYLIYDESLAISQEYENNIIWTRKLKEAIADDRVIPYFQPIVNNASQKVEKYECLVRLREAGGQIISPGSFLEVARRARIYSTLTRIVLEKSVNAFQNHTADFSINISVQDIEDRETHEFIREALRNNPDIAPRLVFEILESEGIENYKGVMDFIREMKDFGCRIAIDDFGSGYSNYAHILRLRVDYVKIDASIVINLPESRDSQILVRSIVTFSRELGLKTVAEHVHSLEVFNKVRELGVDYSQGFYFGKPEKHLRE